MQGYEVKFNVYAETQVEADMASARIKAFIGELAQDGIAVTANKLSEAVTRWKGNYFVKQFFKQ